MGGPAPLEQEDGGGPVGADLTSGRGAHRTMTTLKFWILAVAYPELDGRLRPSQQPQGASSARGAEAPATEGAASHMALKGESTESEGTNGTEGEESSMTGTGGDTSDSDSSSDGSSLAVAGTFVPTPTTGAAHIHSQEDGAMAKNRGQGQRCGTASKKSEGHQEEVERPTGEGPLRNVTPPEGPDISTPPTEEAHSDDSSSALLDPDDQPGPSWASGQLVPLAQAQPNTDLPPSGNTSTAPTQRAHTSLPRTRQSAVCPPLQGTQDNPPPQQQQGPGGSGSGHTVQGTEAQEHRGTGRAALRQGVDRPREPTLHEALSSIMGAYHHSQETMATVLAKFQETQRLQDELYLGFREELRTISSALGTIVGVLKDIQKTMRDTVALRGAPDTSQDDELPTTSAGASGQDAPPQDHHTSTPPPAGGQPPRKRSLRSRNRTEQDGKTPAGK
ncbi:hypothetical protein NDU88_006809 [Pleurodeles waltl]|uniref:Uncharacterized protein n=1 Tax=Pleurodeles waltl TaxID=8319 RepID=A0AAV7QIS3_PLEWA|nr:hypothetical protein NDU88_006809 [Pleurodeles waltl]